MAWIEKRGKGQRVKYGVYENGVRIQRSKSFPTAKEAKELNRTAFSNLSVSFDELYQSILPSMNDPSLLRVIDITGTRWVRCKNCGQIKTEDKFWTYQGKTGSCKECR